MLMFQMINSKIYAWNGLHKICKCDKLAGKLLFVFKALWPRLALPSMFYRLLRCQYLTLLCQ